MNTKLNSLENWPELARQANWSITALASLCGVSTETLRRQFWSKTGKSPRQWLAEERQRQAVALLRDGYSIKEAASCVGYKQQTNFTRKFKKFWGACPSQPPPDTLKSRQVLRK